MRRFLITAALVFAACAALTGPIEMATEAIRAMLPGTGELRVERVRFSPAQRAELARREIPVQDPLPLWIAGSGGEIRGYGLVRRAMGRFDPFWIAVACDTSLTVRGVEVLEYRSPYGGEVRSHSFLDQFVGRDDPARLRPGREIDGISGATISTRSLSEQVAHALAVLRLLRDGGDLRKLSGR
ncbi:MAG: hypothetical protein MAG453_02095 [Calditrichaeota bacterium]|nr:hypothetical protein [Calditrichota bacterium]